MNELTETRALRTNPPLPDPEQLDRQRSQLLDVIQHDKGRQWRTLFTVTGASRSPRRRILMATAAGAALAVTGGVVAQLPHGAPAGGREVLSAKATAAALELAAATVEQKGATEPGPKQWVYAKGTRFVGGKPQTSEQWTRWDGTGSASLPAQPPAGHVKNFDPNKLHVWYGPNQEEKRKKEGYDDRSQRQFYRFLATLPSDPDQMMQRIRQEHAIGDIKGETHAQRDWREIDVLFRSVLIPPKVQAGMFRALAKIPGARVEKGVKDPLGREAIGVTVNFPKRTAAGWQGKQEIFLDPQTYEYRGEISRVAPLGDYRPEGLNPRMQHKVANSNLISEARVASGVVNKPGERP
ncbi:CU044_5270 family protein [Streptomyces sp. NBC_00873]|uniref:CU044_5270 family protein n=1 Tax=Streptomyces sp. NBC_00873 TaxID=2975852 RepID=UPI00386B944D|nr:CU044_5270 family protein [Streptomyces sp. NBC_00873]